jgi:hypothetical protein
VWQQWREDKTTRRPETGRQGDRETGRQGDKEKRADGSLYANRSGCKPRYDSTSIAWLGQSLRSDAPIIELK